MESEKKSRFGVARLEKSGYPAFRVNLPTEYRLADPPGRSAEACPKLTLSLPEKLEIGQCLQVRLFFSTGINLDAIEILAEVVEMEPPSDLEAYYKSRVRLLGISKEDRSTLGNFLSRLSGFVPLGPFRNAPLSSRHFLGQRPL